MNRLEKTEQVLENKLATAFKYTRILVAAEVIQGGKAYPSEELEILLSEYTGMARSPDRVRDLTREEYCCRIILAASIYLSDLITEETTNG